MIWKGVLLGPVSKQLSINITRWIPTCCSEIQVVVMMCVATPSHRLNMNQSSPTTRYCELSRYCRGCVEHCRISAINGPGGYSHCVPFVTKSFCSRLCRIERVECNLVILNHKANWQSTCPCEIHCFPELSATATTLSNRSQMKPLHTKLFRSQCHSSCSGTCYW